MLQLIDVSEAVFGAYKLLFDFGVLLRGCAKWSSKVTPLIDQWMSGIYFLG